MEILESSERRFTKKLCDSMIPSMIETYWEIWLEAKKESKGKNTTLVFQELLRNIKTWNSSISLKHADKIKNAHPLFQNFLAAVFICHVKILMNGVRMDKKPKKVGLKLPPHDVFVQRCYEACGEDLYYRPTIITDASKTDEERKKELTERFGCKIQGVIEDLIPWDAIVGDLKQDADFDENEPVEEEPMEEEVPTDEPAPEEGVPEDTGNLEDIANDSNANANEQAALESAAPNSTEPVAETPNGSQTYAITPSLKPPVVKKLDEKGESLFDDAREK
jgi:Family of unknown function (DUF5764)